MLSPIMEICMKIRKTMPNSVGSFTGGSVVLSAGASKISAVPGVEYRAF